MNNEGTEKRKDERKGETTSGKLGSETWLQRGSPDHCGEGGEAASSDILAVYVYQHRFNLRDIHLSFETYIQTRIVHKMLREINSEAIRLPTVPEIEAATEPISTSDATAKVVRVNDHFAVKMGHSVTLIDAENMMFLQQTARFQFQRFMRLSRTPETIKLIL